MKKYGLSVVVCLILFGSIYVIPDEFVNRFFTFPAVWLVGGITACVNIFCLFRCKPLNYSVGVVLALLSAVGLVVFSSFSALNSLAGLFVLWAGVVFLLTNVEKLPEQLPRCYNFLALLGVVQALWGVAQYFHFLPVYAGSFRVTGTFDNPAGFAACLALLFPFVLYQGEKKSGGGWIWRGVCGVMMVVAMVMSGSRTGCMALFVVGLLWLGHKTSLFAFLDRWKPAVRWGTGIFLAITVLLMLYFVKQDSADGRLLIWRVSADMVTDAPVFGQGAESFGAKYMAYQADYFAQHSGSRFALLADNVKYPFNEGFKVMIEYGLVGLLFLIIYVVAAIRCYYHAALAVKRPALESLMALAVCGCFSYPFSYPVVWGVSAFSFAILFYPTGNVRRFRPCFGFLYLICVVTLFILGGVLQVARQEREWHYITCRSLAGDTEQMLPRYTSLYPKMRKDGLFLYNYGAELNVVGRWHESAVLLEACSQRLNDVDVQLLLADNYMNMADYAKTEKCLLLASQMCPNRFLPLYHLVQLYELTGRPTEALRLAREIVRKTVKIPSYTVDKIKMEMEEYVNNAGVK